MSGIRGGGHTRGADSGSGSAGVSRRPQRRAPAAVVGKTGVGQVEVEVEAEVEARWQGAGADGVRQWIEPLDVPPAGSLREVGDRRVRGCGRPKAAAAARSPVPGLDLPPPPRTPTRPSRGRGSRPGTPRRVGSPGSPDTSSTLHPEERANCGERDVL